jgi:hypothetical protein
MLCSECNRLWEAYYKVSVDQFRVQEEHAAAKLENLNPRLIASLAATEELLSKALSVASGCVVAHRAIHRADSQRLSPVPSV